MASKRRIRKRSCGNKQRHETQAEAVSHLISLSRKVGYKGHTYKCPHCGKWHIGREKKR